MNLMEPSFDATTFTKNRERLLRHGVGQALFGEVVLEADRQGLLSDEHFTVDGTLIEAAASLNSFKPKDGDPPRTTDADPGNPSVDFHYPSSEKGKGKEARLMAHVDGKPAWDADFQTTQATGTAERDIQLLGQDGAFIPGRCPPGTAWRTSRARGDAAGAEQQGAFQLMDSGVPLRFIFGWMKTVGGFRRTRYRGLDHWTDLVATAYNLVRMSKLLGPLCPVPQNGSATPKGLKVPCERHNFLQDPGSNDLNRMFPT